MQRLQRMMPGTEALPEARFATRAQASPTTPKKKVM